MISHEDLYKLILSQNTPYVRILNVSGHKLAAIEDCKNAQQTVDRLKQLLPYFAHYDKVEVQAADEKTKSGNYSRCHVWTVMTPKVNTPAGAQQQQPFNYPGGWNYYAAPPGFVSADVMKAELAKIQLEQKLQKQIDELKAAQQQNNPLAQYGFLAPFVGKALGWKTEEMKEMFGMAALANNTFSNVKAVAGLPQAAPVNTLTFDTVEKMSNEEKNKQIESKMNELTTKVSADEILILLDLLNQKPELAAKCIAAHNAGMF